MKNIIYDKSGKVNKNIWVFLFGIIFLLTLIFFVLAEGGGAGVWMDLSGNDTGNWVTTSNCYGLGVNPNDNLVYTLCDLGKFGAYNHSNGVWMDLSGNDTGDWVSTQSSVSVNIVIDLNASLVYTGHNSGLFGVYNHSNGVWMDLSGNDTGNWVGTNQLRSLSYSKNDNLVYTGATGGKFGVYNHSNGVWMNLSGNDTGDWVGIQKDIKSISVDSNNNLVYTGLGGGGTSGNGTLFGVYNHSNGVWMNLSGNDTGNWASNISTGDTNTLSALGFNPNDNLVYTGFNDGKFGVYNHSNGVWMDLSGNDTGDWVGTSPINDITVNNNTNLIYTSLDSGKFGVYNHSNGVWMNLSGNDTGDWVGMTNVNGIDFNPNNNLVYTALFTGKFGVYNQSVLGGEATPPNITSLKQYPNNASAYSSSQFYSFNATVVNNLNDVDDVRFEFNNINYTPVNDTINPTIFNITLPIQLGTGIYNYKWIANDSSNNKNVTSNATTILNATSLGNLTLNEFDRNITVHAGRQFTINASLLTGIFDGANINLTMNETELNFSSTTNISHTLTLNKRESGVNFTMFYSGNQNFSSFSETWFVEVAGVNVTLINPANELNSSTANTTFGANGSTSYGVLTNSTLIIWNSTGWRIYNETNTETAGTDNSTIRNVSRILDSDDYLWNYEFCNNESSCGFASTNNTLRIYGGNFGINTVDFSNDSLNELTFVRIALSPFSVANNYIKYWNITVRHPDGGSLLFDDVNATWGFFNPDRYNTTNTLNFNKTGIYEINTTLTDRYGTTIIKMTNVTISYSLTSSPNNHSFAAITSRTETNTIDYVVYDDSEGYINLSIVAAIRDSPNFTLVLSQSSILLNNSESSSIPFRFYLNVTGGSDVANGTYNGNITIRNDTYGIYRQINFTYYIQPPSGVPTIRQQGTTTACTTFTTDACAVKRDNMSVGDTFSKVWSINNTGGYQLKRCDAQYIGTFKDASFISFSQTNFTLDVNNSIDLTATFIPTGLSPGYGTFEDYLKIYCIDGDIGGNPTSTPASGWVYSRIIIKEPGFEGQGGGGSPPGGGGGPGGIKIIITQGNWTMKTNTGTSAYQLKVSPGQKRTDKTLLFKNIGNIPIPVNLTCEGSLCSNIEFEQTSFLLPVNKALITEKGFTLNVPEDLVEGSYSINLVAIDNLKQREVVTVNFDVSKINILAPFQKAISGKIKFLKGTISLWIILLVILILTIIVSYNLIWKKFSLGPFFSFLTGFAAMVIALILFNTIEPVT